MGRKKIAIQQIADNRRRQVTFSRRRFGLMKKAYELSVLCNCDIGLIMFTPNDKLFSYSSRPMSDLLHKYSAYIERDLPAEALINKDMARLVEHDKTEHGDDFDDPMEDDDVEEDDGTFSPHDKLLGDARQKSMASKRARSGGKKPQLHRPRTGGLVSGVPFMGAVGGVGLAGGSSASSAAGSQEEMTPMPMVAAGSTFPLSAFPFPQPTASGHHPHSAANYMPSFMMLHAPSAASGTSHTNGSFSSTATAMTSPHGGMASILPGASMSTSSLSESLPHTHVHGGLVTASDAGGQASAAAAFHFGGSLMDPLQPSAGVGGSANSSSSNLYPGSFFYFPYGWSTGMASAPHSGNALHVMLPHDVQLNGTTTNVNGNSTTASGLTLVNDAQMNGDQPLPSPESNKVKDGSDRKEKVKLVECKKTRGAVTSEKARLH